MRVDVVLGPRCLPPDRGRGKAAVVVDVLRAGTTVAYALTNGAERVIPVVSVRAARRLARGFPRQTVLLCGERRALPPPGFDLGNSPREFTPDRVRGKTLVLTTTNATRALSRLRGAAAVALVGLVNAPAASRWLAGLGSDAVIVCAGRANEPAAEDILAAGIILNELRRQGEVELTDAARVAGEWALAVGERALSVLQDSQHGRYLCSLGMAADVEVCSQVGLLTTLAVLRGDSLVGVQVSG
ncbi:MAG: 2-phosphosulfolactate phosphatase [candidate division KSB1 bacterium]|nr:2-phosphosulfolactate phosphatase [candidate division KSB1 bacterium]